MLELALALAIVAVILGLVAAGLPEHAPRLLPLAVAALAGAVGLQIANALDNTPGAIGLALLS